ncbi:ribonuclease III [bacterium]|nr:ribonuclease III [bacterium]
MPQTLDDKVKALEKNIGYTFKNKELIHEALTHPSIPAVDKDYTDNQRLEFLGDSVLGITTVEYLFHNYPNWDEGKLTQRKNLLVSSAMLAQSAKLIQLGDAMIVGASEEMNKGRERKNLLEDAFEALLGALYLDAGIEVCKKLIIKLVLKDGFEFAKKSNLLNFKNALLEHLQNTSGQNVEFRVVNETGPEHLRVYTTEVWYNGDKIGTGEGPSKAKSSMDASRDAVENLKINMES